MGLKADRSTGSLLKQAEGEEYGAEEPGPKAKGLGLYPPEAGPEKARERACKNGYAPTRCLPLASLRVLL